MNRPLVNRMGVSFSFAAVAVGLAGFSNAQILNGSFSSGDLAGWTLAVTQNGATAVNDVVFLDIDEAGPLTQSQAARFAVGNQIQPTQGQQGIELTQSVCLVAGASYRFDLDWKAYREIDLSGNGEGGRFNLVVNGVSIASGAAGTIGAVPKAGHLTGNFTPPATGLYVVGVTITRQFTIPFSSGVPTLYQAIDNFEVTSPSNLNIVTPSGFTLHAGIPFGGNVASLAESDDDKVYILNDEAETNATIELLGTGTNPATSGCFTAETSATRTDLTEFLDLYDFVVATWENVASRPSLMADTRLTSLMWPRHVSGTGEVRARVRWIPQSDLEAADGWSEAVDFVEWRYL